MAIAAYFDGSEAIGERARAPRRTLRLAVAGERAGGEAAAVQIHNASSTGLLIESDMTLEEGERITVDLPHAGPTAARIVWRSGRLHGCRFDEPVSQAALSAAELRSVAGSGIAPAERSQSTAGLGSRLRELRKARGLTLAQIAEALSVSKPTVWAWEHGKARPLENRLGQIAEALGVDSDSLRTQETGQVPSEVLENCRSQIAEAAGVSPTSVRILIEL